MKLVVKEPTLCSPTEKQMSATEWSVAQQRGGPPEAPRQQVGVRRLAERPAELAAEVRARKPGCPREVVHVERLEIARVGQVLGPEEVARGWREGRRHRRSP